jgi:hypothetical protein
MTKPPEQNSDGFSSFSLVARFRDYSKNYMPKRDLNSRKLHISMKISLLTDQHLGNVCLTLFHFLWVEFHLACNHPETMKPPKILDGSSINFSGYALHDCY